jgi:hypothetical protein
VQNEKKQKRQERFQKKSDGEQEEGEVDPAEATAGKRPKIQAAVDPEMARKMEDRAKRFGAPSAQAPQEST